MIANKCSEINICRLGLLLKKVKNTHFERYLPVLNEHFLRLSQEMLVITRKLCSKWVFFTHLTSNPMYVKLRYRAGMGWCQTGKKNKLQNVESKAFFNTTENAKQKQYIKQRNHLHTIVFFDYA